MKKIYPMLFAAILFAASGFAQPCNPITTFPFTESFGATFPTCWSFSEGSAGAGIHWATTTADAGDGVSGPQSGTNFMFLDVYNAQTGYNPYNLTSPTFALPAAAKQLKYFYYIGTNGYHGTSGSTGADPYPLTVQVSTDGGITWTDIYNHNNSNTTFASSNAVSNWTLNTVSLATYVNQNVIIRFISNSNYGFGSCNQAIDEFVIQDIPSCTAPTAVTIGTISTTSSSVGFTCTACSGSYIVEYGAPGFTPGSAATAGAGGTVVTGAASPITISGLTPNTTYDVYVRQNCGAGSFSQNSIKVTFTTSCNTVPLPLNEGFNNSTIPSCWTRQFVSGNRDFQYTALSNGIPNPTPFEGTRMVWFNSYNGSGDQTLLVSPSLNSTGVPSVDVNFQWYYSSNGGATSYLTEGVQVQYSTNGTTWANAGTLIRRYDAVTGWALKNVTLPAGAGNQAILYVGFLFTSNAGYDSYLDAVAINTTPLCPAPTALSSSSITSTSASVSFTSPGPALLEYGLSNFTPGTGATAGAGGTLINPATSPQSVIGLAAGTQYDVYLRQNCTGSGNGYSVNSNKLTFTTKLANDDAPGAMTLTVGAGCTGAPYTNSGATQSAGEPFGSCSRTTGYATVWFKFIAPPSGAVRVSTDLGSGNTLSDSRVALFSSTNVNDYTAFNILACDEDGGSFLGSGYMSVLYATELTPGNIYYIQVDQYSAGTTSGTFCVAVDELSSSMLAATNNCSSPYQSPLGGVATYNGWVPLLDGSSKLVALVRNPAGGSVNSYTVGENINSGVIRQNAPGKYYLDRNYRIANSSATNVDVQFFFLNTELAALTTADGALLATLGATKQTEAIAGCFNNFSAANGSTLFLTQNANGSVNGVSWIKVTVPGFSNFYLNKVGSALPLTISTFNVQRNGTVNNVTWSTSQEINTNMFVIERSTDGRNFTLIGQVAAAGNSSTLRTYQFTDLSPVKGINYYRLRIIDRDNNTKISEIRSVRNTGNADFTIYPNPVKDVMKVDINADKADKGIMIITDISGKQVYSRFVNVVAGNNTFSVDIINMAPGSYIIKVQLSEDMIVKKFTKM